MLLEVVHLKFAIVGGDDRSALLCSLLFRDGHRVHSFALEKAELPGEIPKAGCLQGCVYGADWVILPTPAERSGLINAPYAAEGLTIEELLGAMWPGQVLCGGALSRESSLAAIRAGLCVQDLMQRRGFTVGNAAVTAEGAIELMMRSSDRTLWRSPVLVTGWGRVAKLLALRLRALGAEVTVAARKEADRAMAVALGLESMDIPALESAAGSFDFIANTVPERIISEAALKSVRGGALLLELASPPGGFDRKLAETLGLAAVAAPGLPGVCAPYTAAELIRGAIYDIIAEMEAEA